MIGGLGFYVILVETQTAVTRLLDHCPLSTEQETLTKHYLEVQQVIQCNSEARQHIDDSGTRGGDVVSNDRDRDNRKHELLLINSAKHDQDGYERPLEHHSQLSLLCMSPYEHLLS